jgi:exosortase A
LASNDHRAGMSATAAAVAEARAPAGPALLALGLLALVALALHASAISLAHTWATTSTYSLGVLIAAAVPWLIWRRRAALAAVERPPLALALLALLATGLLWLAARRAAIDVAAQAMLPACAAALVLAVLGPGALRRLAFPLLWLYFAIPVWEAFVEPLQHLTTIVVRVALGLIGIPVVRNGDFLSVPAGTFEVAHGCSGLNFLLVSLTIATLYGHLQNWARRERLTLVATACGVAFLANWLRVFVIVVIGERSQMRSSLIVEGHYVFGWWLFAGSLVLFFLATARWWPPPRPDAAPVLRPALPARAIWRRLALAVAGLALPAVLDALAVRGEELQAATVHAVLPVGTAGWSGPLPAIATWRPAFSGPTDEALASYDGVSGRVTAVETLYALERSSAKLVGYPSDPAGAAGTVRERVATVELPLQGGAGTQLRQMHLRSAEGERWAVLQFYRIDGHTVSGEMALKLREGLRALGQHGVVAAVSFATPCAASCGEVEDRRLADFAAAMYGPFANAADAAGETR